MQDLKRLRDSLLIIGFLAGLVLPLVGTDLHGLFKPAGHDQAADAAPPDAIGLADRAQASLVHSPRESLRRRMVIALQAARNNFQNTFGFRGDLIHWHGLLKVQGLHVSSSDLVTLGKDGWLFHNEDRIDDYRGLLPLYTHEELESWRKAVEAQQIWLARRGIHYILVIGPDKQSVYPELMPDNITRVRTETRSQQLVAYLEQHSTVPIVDSRAALLAAKPWGDLYYRTDSHWNLRGGFVVSAAILGALQRWYPQVHLTSRQGLHLDDIPGPGGDLSRFLGIQQDVTEVRPALPSGYPQGTTILGGGATLPSTADIGVSAPFRSWFVSRAPQGEIPRLVFFHDSFGVYLSPFLEPHFQWAAHCWNRKLLPAIVEEEHPAVVIQETVEPFLRDVKKQKALW